MYTLHKWNLMKSSEVACGVGYSKRNKLKVLMLEWLAWQKVFKTVFAWLWYGGLVNWTPVCWQTYIHTCLINTPDRGFSGPTKQKEWKNRTTSTVKNPNWPEATQLTIYKRDREVDPVVRAGLERLNASVLTSSPQRHCLLERLLISPLSLLPTMRYVMALRETKGPDPRSVLLSPSLSSSSSPLRLFVREWQIERLSYEKVFAICFTDQCLATLKQSLSLF